MPNAGQVIRALDIPETKEVDDATSILDISNTSFDPGSPVASVTFTAPTSGQVKVTVYGRLRTQTSGGFILLSFEVRETDSTGTVVQEASDSTSAQTADVDVSGHEVSKLVSGLIAGATYYVQTMHRVTAGAEADILDRRIIVSPAP